MSVEALSVSDLSDEERVALRRAIRSLADSKRLMGIRYSDWLLGAPSIEAGIAASSMCQDEWGHARLLYAMLKDFGVSPEAVEHERPASEYASVDVLDTPFEDWAAVVAGMVIVDGAITAALGGFAEGAFEPAQSRLPKMLVEEGFHVDMGNSWFRRLAGGSEDAREHLLRACEAFLPRTLAWLTPGDRLATTLAQRGVTHPPESVRERFEARVGPLLSLLDLDVSVVAADRSDWDEKRGRGPGQPNEESVVRARGDENRALFVE